MRRETHDVVVIGAGPAGLAAATAAAECGKRVCIIDENPAIGGQIWRPDLHASPEPAVLDFLAALDKHAVCIHAGTSLVHLRDEKRLFAMTREGLLQLDCEALVLATGARELFLPFPGWTLPSVMGAGGLQALVKGGYNVSGKKIVIAGSGPLLIAVAAFLKKKGAKIICLAEQAPLLRLQNFAMQLMMHASKMKEALRFKHALKGVPKSFSSWPLRAEGSEELEAVVLRTRRGEQRLSCELLACSYGLVPELAIARHLDLDIENGALVVDAMQACSKRTVFAAGEITGIGGRDKAIVEGRIAGLCAAGEQDVGFALRRKRKRELSFARKLGKAFRLRPELKDLPDDDCIVCRCEDVTYSAIRRHKRARAAKLESRAGMGQCQGRICAPAMEFLMGWKPETRRAPFEPISLESLREICESAEA